MSSVLNALTSSFPAGSLFHTRVRVAYSLPVFFTLVLLKSHDLLIGTSLILILIGSVLLQQFAQMFVARRSGGDVHEVLLWPLGSLARIQLGFKLKGRLFTWLSVPLTHLLICLATLPFIHQTVRFPDLLYITALPVAEYSTMSFAQLGREFLALAFYVNWLLMLINLLPAIPLSGGRLTEELMLGHFNTVSANRIAYALTTFIGFVLLLTGVVASHVWLALFGAILVAWTLYEKIRLLETAPTKDESELFLGYDFSAGYTSLEHSRQPERTMPPRPGIIARWKARRNLQQRRKANVRRQQAQQRIDALLEKVSETGLSSLSATEHKQLKQASQYLRPQQSK
ncbi:hypothetical protein Pla110_27630 [Polystyrenella longa]|uniref:DUF6576 domain-containing protein n=1 Tax=Polystyrenella longa TaxID=2528007 RepID=A0A518CP67_9PLAN|nr:DUF6576 domain-containing protein [Polystyrenella longa]QDU81026.1 hypothetical protein Pla110_27630 [Polystyrenella longa]